MQINVTYPAPEKSAIVNRRKLLSVVRWPAITSAAASVIVNLAIGGPWWCIIVLFSIYMAWKLIFSLDLVEYNRISQTIKFTVLSCILLTLIDVLLINGWAAFVVPLVCFGGLLLASVLFLTDIDRQKHNLLPLILLIFFAILASALALSFIWEDQTSWPYIALGGTALLALIVIISILGMDFLREMKRRFHIK